MYAAPAFVAAAPPAPPGELRAQLERLVRKGGVAVSLDGEPEWAYGTGAYLPASILKIATALAALETLGAGYRFLTEIYRDGAGHLILRGYGDPRLVSEEWDRMGAALADLGAFDEPLRDVVVDDSAIAAEEPIAGRGNSLNPYDARLGALVSNFNTVNLAVSESGGVTSAEPQTPLTPLARELAAGLGPGVQRINLSRRPGHGVRYSGELARAIFRRHGARFTGTVRRGSLPPGAERLLAHRSTHTLRDVVRDMMEFSNNFIANQLLLTLALERHGAPARLDSGVALLRRHLTRRLGLDPDSFRLAEGSGLSRSNRFDLLAMLRVVDAFHPWRDLLQSYGEPPLTAPAKTGSLDGIFTLAGFLPAPPGHRRAFVIMLNQPRNTRQPVFEALLRQYAKDPVE
ncbi:MAG: D-alanyl-D-alanine carboxypeptidase [SAR324 cluster bacterium]|nr:D-alanyl-D-alanine carboxypeptidase [SAR324 cluster bacterium]